MFIYDFDNSMCNVPLIKNKTIQITIQNAFDTLK